jgi:hypothetical protein
LAAATNVFEQLDTAMRSNVLATLSLLEISKTFHHLEAFIHCSTAFVNADRDGFQAEVFDLISIYQILQVLPPLNFDPEEMAQLILQMHPNEIEKATPSILGNYPNVYTFTKAMAERILVKIDGFRLIVIGEKAWFYTNVFCETLHYWLYLEVKQVICYNM